VCAKKNNHSRIVKLQVAQVKRLSVVEITPDGAVVIIRGKNSAGKSSVLDSIMYALGGKKAIPSQPIKQGEDSATIRIKVENVPMENRQETLIVERKFRRKGKDCTSEVEIRTENGYLAPSPQAILDGLYGKLAFDPTNFIRLAPKEQAETLKELIGLDFTALDAQRVTAYHDRTEVNRQLKATQARFAGMPVYPDAPEKEVDPSEMSAEMKRRQEINCRNQTERLSCQGAEQAAEAAVCFAHSQVAFVAELEKRLAEARKKLAVAEKTAQAATKTAATLKTKIGQLQDEDIQELADRLADIGRVNNEVQANARRAAEETQLAELQTKAGGYTAKIAQIDEAKAKQITEAQFPVEGLGFGEEGVTFGGLPFEQAGRAEQIAVSVAMGLALSPNLRVVLIRDASLLDEDSLAQVATVAAEYDGQVWLEMVGEEGSGASVVIEDGHVRGQEPAMCAGLQS